MADSISAADFDHNGCQGWTEKQCGGMSYWGGKGECGRGSTLSRVIEMSNYPGATKVGFRGVLWTVDSWDNEHAYIKMMSSNG